MRKISLLFLAMVCIIGAGLTFNYWPSIKHRWHKLMANKQEQLQEIQAAKDLLNQGKPDAALEIIHRNAENIENHSEIGKEWLDLLIRASTATFNTPQLMSLYDYYPKAFDSQEKAALLVAAAYIASGRTRDYQQIRDTWKGRETTPESWFVLDADKLIQEGKSKEAVELLKSRSFQGKADTARLVHLALLSVMENPKEAWDYLTQAHTKDPENPDILSYRARLLETIGKDSQALYEYLDAIHVDPKNMYLKDQLAEFYLRQKEYANALEVWKEILKNPSSAKDFIWIKALFWSKVLHPLQIDWKTIKLPHSKLDPFINYLVSLQPGEFWNKSEFEKLDNYQQYLNTQQSTYWLRLLQYLKEGKDNAAYELLQFNPFVAFSWNPDLEKALKRILTYRKTGMLTEAGEVGKHGEPLTQPDAVKLQENAPQFFGELEIYAHTQPNDKNKMPASLKELLTSSDAFSAAMLAAGWEEAAIDLSKLSVYPATFPDWVAFSMTQAIKSNRGINEALKYATLQQPSPMLSMIVGELLIASHHYDAALERLKKLYKDKDQIGKRSAWLMSLIYMDRGEYKEAESTINAQPLLEKDLLGQETLARISLLEGNTARADKIYTSLVDRSPEAKSYLARKAYEEKDWPKAKELTEALLRDYPTNMIIQQNYKKIIDELNQTQKQK